MTTPIRLLAISFLALGLVAGPQAFASKNIYRWVDDKGVTHYGDRPNADSEHLRVRRGKAIGPSDEEKKEAAEMLTLRKEQCEKAQSRYALYNESSRLIEKDDFGKERELSSDERLTAIAKSKRDVAEYCSKK